MSARTRRLGLATGLFCWLAACGPSAPAGAVVLQQTVSVTLLVDGSVEVREALTVSFPEPATRFERYVPLERADAYFDARASLDGRPVDAATRPASAEIETADGLRVRWAFPEAATTHEFVLEYRASNAVSVHGANGLLYWRILPLRPALPIVSSNVAFTVANGIAFMVPPTIDAAGLVRVDAERQEARLRLSAWLTEPGPSGLTASRGGIGSGDEAFLWARLVADTMALAEPAWQYDAARAEELKLAWLAGGAFMVVVGAGALVMIAVLYPGHRRRARRAGPATDVETLAPALAQRLRRRRGRAGSEIGAALRGLEARGAIRFERPADSPGSGADRARVVLVDPPAEMFRHERVLLDELWLGRAQGGSDASDLLQAPRRLRRKFAAALTRDLVATGYVTADRLAVADGLRLAIPAIVVLALLCGAAVRLWLHHFGVWPYAVPVGIGILGLMLLPYAATFSTLTEAGERAALALGRRR